VTDDRPWLAQYAGRPPSLELRHEDALSMARAGLREMGDAPWLHYFTSSLSGNQVQRDSDALAVHLAAAGVGRGDRVAVQLQNQPQFILALLATWKLGAVFVPVNPMYRARELAHLLSDSGATALVLLEDVWDAWARDVVRDSPVRAVLTTSALDYLDDGELPEMLAGIERHRPGDAEDFVDVIGRHRGSAPPELHPAPGDIASMVYTSGTTGPPKGATNTHRNMAFQGHSWPAWIGLGADDRLMAVAPLFHITGLAGHAAAALCVPMPIVLAYRFDAAETLRLMEHHRTTYTVAAITAFTALMNCDALAATDLSAWRVAYSGGAPVPAALVAQFREATGITIHNCYGLTETTSATHIAPIGVATPIDPTSGALSIGLPVFDTACEIHDDDGRPLPPGEIGQLVIGGPEVVPGYWQKPEETANAFPDGRLRTGDVGFMDRAGWFYLVDRSKDLILAAGYKVWPREVEDVLYEHPAVREAAVVGVPDEYRGETVRAFVSLKPGREATADELIAFCKERMAAYKYPRIVDFVDELPKTLTGKILRRELRERD
jgi:long-chain acyl-CoA synthetase